MTSCQ